jgi:hypothetical protein
MKKRINLFITTVFAALALVFTPAFSTPAFAVLPSEPDTAGACSGQFFTFPAWHNGLPKDSDCRIKITSLNAIWVIGFNILNIGIQVAAYTAAFIMFFMIFKMLTARGDPGKISSAGLGIRNSIIGLIIALISVAIVQFVTNSIASAA